MPPRREGGEAAREGGVWGWGGRKVRRLGLEEAAFYKETGEDMWSDAICGPEVGRRNRFGGAPILTSAMAVFIKLIVKNSK